MNLNFLKVSDISTEQATAARPYLLGIHSTISAAVAGMSAIERVTKDGQDVGDLRDGADMAISVVLKGWRIDAPSYSEQGYYLEVTPGQCDDIRMALQKAASAMPAWASETQRTLQSALSSLAT